MNWVTRVRNALPFVAKRETAETLWEKCKGCEAMVFLKEYEENQSVCPKCDHHGRIGPAERFAAIFDDDSYKILPPPQSPKTRSNSRIPRNIPTVSRPRAQRPARSTRW